MTKGIVLGSGALIAVVAVTTLLLWNWNSAPHEETRQPLASTDANDAAVTAAIPLETGSGLSVSVSPPVRDPGKVRRSGDGSVPANLPGNISAADEVAQRLATPSLHTDRLLSVVERHPDGNVRNRALESLLEEGVIPPRESLERILKSDQSDAVRETAFRALTEMSDADVETIRAAVVTALSDPDGAIRARAEELLADMDREAARLPVAQGE